MKAEEIEQLIQDQPVPEYINMRRLIWWFIRRFDVDESQFLAVLARMFDAGIHDLTEDGLDDYRRGKRHPTLDEFVDYVISEAVPRG